MVLIQLDKLIQEMHVKDGSNLELWDLNPNYGLQKLAKIDGFQFLVLTSYHILISVTKLKLVSINTEQTFSRVN